jgi:hypothetical protein
MEQNSSLLEKIRCLYYCYINRFLYATKIKISRLLNDQFNKKYGGKKLWTL